jgi:hypothetical protein
MSPWSRLFLATLALVALSALAPGNAFAHGWGGHGGHGGWGGHGWGGHFGGFHGRFGGGYYGGYPGYAPGCVWVRRVVPTPWGLQWRVVPACYYGY